MNRARARGIKVAWTRCRDLGTVPPFWVWEQLLRETGGAPLPVTPEGPPAEDAGLARIRLFDDDGSRLSSPAGHGVEGGRR
ncbi:MAG TPA: hypothetical protein VMZ73_10475 [Acidimicrobiales bacterium]|nr:hypothetical protein [Acidimicrobiales bacterium]